MRWEDERYVRVYVRDTAEWLALGWEAQALLVLLLRKADRAGIVQTGKAGARGLAALVGMPLDVAQRALAVLLEDGCLREMAGGYVFPNFLPAQEAKSSDAQRKREQRARDRDKAIAGGASGSRAGLDIEATMSRASGQDAGHVSHPSVTPDGHTAPDNVTGVTDSVTPSRAVPCRAEPSRTLSASQAPAVAAPPGDDLPDATEEAACLQAPPLPAKTTRKRPDTPRGDPRHAPLVEALVAAFAEARRATYGFQGGRDAKLVTELLALADQDERTRGEAAPGEVVRRWRIALAWEGFPGCSTLADLKRSWNYYAVPQKRRPANGYASPATPSSLDSFDRDIPGGSIP